MPRNKSLLKTGGGGSSNGRRSKKIVIRPYQKPPALPPQYYDTTVQELLQVTRAVLHKTTTTTTTTLSSNDDRNTSTMSLQNAYTAVVALVSHQLGPRLYRDLKASLEEACATVLTSETANSHLTVNSSNTILQTIPPLYQQYTEYLLCVKHVFLPLDRTHVWQSDTQQVLPIKGTSATSVATSSTTSAATTSSTPAQQQQSLWQVGLSVWANRLQELGLDTALYQAWMQALLQEWNGPTSSTTSTTTTALSSTTSTLLHSTSDQSSAFALQSVWYMWQDLGSLGKLPLQHDLQVYWQRQSQTFREDPSTLSSLSSSSSSSSYRPVAFLEFCYDKHARVAQWATWLPAAWLQSIIEQVLFAPHLLDLPTTTTTASSSSEQDHVMEDSGDPMNKTAKAALSHEESLLLESSLFPGSTDTAASAVTGTRSTSMSNKCAKTTPGILLQPKYFHPLLEDAIFGQAKLGESSSSPATPMAQLWMLAGRIPHGQATISKAIANFAKTNGLQRLQSTPMEAKKTLTATSNTPTATTKKDPIAAVGDLLQLQQALSKLIRSLPQGAESIQLKSVWEEVVNQDINPPVAESLAKFLDQILKSNKRMDQYQRQQQLDGESTTSSDDWLQKILAGVFIPLQAKDVFEVFYKKDLAKRLLWNRVLSHDVEKQVVSLLKAECGAAYTSKMEGMFQDVDWSRETMMVYKQSAQPQQVNSKMEMEVQVLTTGYWPVYPQHPDLVLPESLKEQQEHFANHYKTKYQGRRMTWQYALGHCIVKSSGFPKNYEFIMSLCQAVVLTQFETAEQTWTLPALSNAIGLKDRGEMERILLSLSVGKEGTRILKKIDHDRGPKKVRHNVHDDDRFQINTKFESNQHRIRINNILMKETKQERDKTVEGVSRDRLYLIDAVLVRIMKARKTVQHQALIPQVLAQAKVPATPADVKKRIEALIEREYLERDEKDRNQYNYLA